jgi:hypothetical protein
MTVKELYEWAIENNAEDYDIEISYRDGGGCYYGVDDCDYPEVADHYNKYNTPLVVLL